MLEFIQSMDAGALLWVQAHLRTALLDGPMIVISTLGNAGLIWIALGVVLTAIPKTQNTGCWPSSPCWSVSCSTICC